MKTIYRRKDTITRRPLFGLILFLLLTAGIATDMVDYVETLPLAIAISAGISLLPNLIYQIWLWTPAPMRQATEQRREEHRQEQNRLTPQEVEQLGILMTGAGLPLASLKKERTKREQKMIGLPTEKIEGHLLVVGATRSGKGMHLTQTLLNADCAMLVVDPKGEQYERTAGHRAEHVGPVYRIPNNTLDLTAYYNLANSDDLQELHYHLMTPWADKQPIFADKCKFLFVGADSYARAYGLNGMLTLLQASSTEPVATLKALETTDYDAVRNFTNGDAPQDLDKFAQSSWGSFTTRMYPYQKHWHTITTGAGLGAIPLNWAEQKATIYITYSFDELKGVGGVVSAIIAALLRYQKMNNRRDKMLVAVDELPTVGLRNVTEYLATVGGYGISMLLYVQTYAQLASLYGEREAQTILSNCQHQVWYPPADEMTAKIMSTLYGTEVAVNQSFSVNQRDKRLKLDLGMKESGRAVNWQIRPALAPEEMFALNEEKVILRFDRKYAIQAYRLWPVPAFKHLPAPAYEFDVMPPTRPRPPWQETPPATEETEPAATDSIVPAFNG